MDRTDIARDMTLMLISLKSWEEGKGKQKYLRAWKGYDFDDLDALAEDGYVDFSYRSKSLVLTPEGKARADSLFGEYGIDLDPIPEKQRYFRLHLRFEFESLSCMRTLLVPEHTTFEDFHTMIQACLNWMNYHLYDFQLKRNGVNYHISWPDYETGGDPRADFIMPGEDPGYVWVSSAEAYLDEFFPTTKEAVYSYDYGDGWEIKITLLNRGEKIASTHPICWEGAGDAPPEDVGGEGGFANFLRVIDNEDDPEYDLLSDWGESQGFERFSGRSTNDRLRHWRDWARVEDE